MGYVKFDMHCHTAEGSVDAKVGIDDYIKILKSKGFNGMVVTDHDSYDGYDAYLSYGKKYDDFVVLRGIEYDSLEFGHFIVARANGIAVSEFALGLGPTILKFKKKGTLFSLKLLPFGGACIMAGEDGSEDGISELDNWK